MRPILALAIAAIVVAATAGIATGLYQRYHSGYYASGIYLAK
jgi:hypothetical protein